MVIIMNIMAVFYYEYIIRYSASLSQWWILKRRVVTCIIDICRLCGFLAMIRLTSHET